MTKQPKKSRPAKRKAAGKTSKKATKTARKKAPARAKKAPAKKKAAPKKKAPRASKPPAGEAVIEVTEFEVLEPAEPEVRRRPEPPPPPLPVDLTPFKIVETSPGHHSLLLTEFDEAAPVFEEAGHDAGGYAWAAVADVVMAERPELAEHCHLDPEASMFCAYGEDRAALEALGRVLVGAWRDHNVLARLARAADWEEWD